MIDDPAVNLVDWFPPAGLLSEEEGMDLLPSLPWLSEACNAALFEKEAAAEAVGAAKTKAEAAEIAEAAAKEACQYGDPSNTYLPLVTDADTDFGETDTEASIDVTTVLRPRHMPRSRCLTPLLS